MLSPLPQFGFMSRCGTPPYFAQHEALILTHENVDTARFDDYLVKEFAPLRPLLAWGYSAQRGRERHQAVAMFWQDLRDVNGTSFSQFELCCSLVQAGLPPPEPVCSIW